jgi:hypothetical protein
MEDPFTPPTQPSGALVPPNKVPGTAIATATPPPPPNRSARRTVARGNVFQRVIDRTLDAVDVFADNVAAGLGLRHR